jgi:hypothetical protein
MSDARSFSKHYEKIHSHRIYFATIDSRKRIFYDEASLL